MELLASQGQELLPVLASTCTVPVSIALPRRAASSICGITVTVQHYSTVSSQYCSVGAAVCSVSDAEAAGATISSIGTEPCTQKVSPLSFPSAGSICAEQWMARTRRRYELADGGRQRGGGAFYGHIRAPTCASHTPRAAQGIFCRRHRCAALGRDGTAAPHHERHSFPASGRRLAASR